MPPPTQIWVETWEPLGVVRADRIVRLRLRGGCNLGLREVDVAQACSDVSFCAEIEPRNERLLLGCTDDVGAASEQLAQLIETLARTSREERGGPVFVFRRDPRGHGLDDGGPWWITSTEFPLDLWGDPPSGLPHPCTGTEPGGRSGVSGGGVRVPPGYTDEGGCRGATGLERQA